MSAVRIEARSVSRDVDIDLSVDDGQVLALLGPNGVGKSTVLAMIAGLLQPDDGVVSIGDTVVTDTTAGVFVPPHARGVAMLAQQAMLFPHMTVAANVAYAPRCRGSSRRAARADAARWLDAVDAGHLADRRPAALSGGQAQRVAVARALAARPRVLLLDEPMAALDVTTAPAVRRLLRTVLRDEHRTAIIVTHDLLDALAIADRVAVLDDGRVVEHGPTQQILTVPRSRFAARLAGVNLVSGTITAPGTLTTAWDLSITGQGDVAPGEAAVALFRPSSVAVHSDPPHGSPRNVLPATIAEVDLDGATARIRAQDQPDGTAGPAADVTLAGAADLALEPGRAVYFVVKAQEVQLHPALR